MKGKGIIINCVVQLLPPGVYIFSGYISIKLPDLHVECTSILCPHLSLGTSYGSYGPCNPNKSIYLPSSNRLPAANGFFSCVCLSTELTFNKILTDIRLLLLLRILLVDGCELVLH